MTKRLIGRIAAATALTVLVAVLLVPAGGQVRAATIVVTTLADENGTNPAACSLREAIAAAGGDAPVDGCPAGAGADIIFFAVSGTIALDPNLGPLSVSGGVLTIQGPGAGNLTIDGGATVQLLVVAAGARLTLTGLTLTQGRSGLGGAIRNEGSLTISSSTLSGNTATADGGAIDNVDGGTVDITASTFSGNRAVFGGAIHNSRGATVTISGSTLSGNTAGALGGAILNDRSGSNATITNSVFSGNTAAGRLGGGAIYNSLSGRVTIDSST